MRTLRATFPLWGRWGLAWLTAMSWAATGRRAYAQGPLLQPLSMRPDERDLDEVDDVPGDDDVLPRDDQGADQPGVKARLGRIQRDEAEELATGPADVRARHDYALAVGGGLVEPWQKYTLEAAFVATPQRVFSLYGGGGHFALSGTTSQKSYDISTDTNGIGLACRFFFANLEHVSLESSLGYAFWNGHITPHGSDDSVQDESAKLGSSFHVSGGFLGFSAALTWVWDNGIYLEWTPIGATWVHLFTKDFSRQSDAAESAVTGEIQEGRLYGLAALKVGYFF